MASESCARAQGSPRCSLLATLPVAAVWEVSSRYSTPCLSRACIPPCRVLVAAAAPPVGACSSCSTSLTPWCVGATPGTSCAISCRLCRAVEMGMSPGQCHAMSSNNSTRFSRVCRPKTLTLIRTQLGHYSTCCMRHTAAPPPADVCVPRLLPAVPSALTQPAAVAPLVPMRASPHAPLSASLAAVLPPQTERHAPQQLSPLHQRIMQDIRSKHLLQPQDTLLLAVSGGQASNRAAGCAGCAGRLGRRRQGNHTLSNWQRATEPALWQQEIHRTANPGTGSLLCA